MLSTIKQNHLLSVLTCTNQMVYWYHHHLHCCCTYCPRL